MARLRVSAISFLNTAPLMWDFAHDEALRRDFEVTYTVPSVCAEAVRTGQADIGIIPVAAYAAIPDLFVVPGVAIAAQDAVRSILLVSKAPIQQVRTVAADTSSRTSVALARVLFRRWFGGPRQFTAMEPELELMLHECDAALLIGDSALKVDRSAYIVYDLAEEWKRLTGKPFVFAFWAVRQDALQRMRPGLNLARVFQRSRDHGTEPRHIAAIARQWAPKLEMSEADIRAYLTHNVDYSLGPQNLEGLELFFRYAVEHGVLPSAQPVRMLPAARARAR